MTDITAADFGLPERECNGLGFAEEMLMKLKNQVTGWKMVPEHVVMSIEQFNELVRYVGWTSDE